MNVLVRRMAAADVEAVLALASELPMAPQWGREAYQAALDTEATPRRVVLIAENEGRIAGFALALLIPPQAELESMAVAAEFQRMGVARRLFEELASELAAAKTNEVLLEVRASNVSALGFYRTLGFEETGRRRGYYSNPPEDALLLRKAIS